MPRAANARRGFARNVAFAVQGVDQYIVDVFRAQRFDEDGVPFSTEAQVEEPAAAAAAAVAAAEEPVQAAVAAAEEPVQEPVFRPAVNHVARAGSLGAFNDHYERMLELDRMLMEAIDNNDQPRFNHMRVGRNRTERSSRKSRISRWPVYVLRLTPHLQVTMYVGKPYRPGGDV